jgi:hypothetical protein
MTFFPHMLKLLCLPGFHAHVSFDEPLTEKLNRKEMARELHARVSRLKDDFLAASMTKIG